MTEERILFEELFPSNLRTQNPLIACEALGYLRCLRIIAPRQSDWIDNEVSDLLAVVIILNLISQR